jgi:hypothetical protein
MQALRLHRHTFLGLPEADDQLVEIGQPVVCYELLLQLQLWCACMGRERGTTGGSQYVAGSIQDVGVGFGVRMLAQRACRPL